MKEVTVGVAQLDHDRTFLQSLSPAERNDLLHAARFFRENEDDGARGGGLEGEDPCARVVSTDMRRLGVFNRVSAPRAANVDDDA